MRPFAVRQTEMWVKSCGIDRDLDQEIFTDLCFGDFHNDPNRVIAMKHLGLASSIIPIHAGCWLEVAATAWFDPTWVCDASRDLLLEWRNVALAGALDLASALLK